MEKPAPVSNPIHPLLVRRFSPRAFSPQGISEEELRSLFEAARWAPSSANEQPWSFLIARREEAEEFSKMLSCLLPGNQRWAGQAAALLFSVARLSFAQSGKPNRHAFYDVGQAIADLTLEATSRNIFAHQMAGFDLEKTRATYAIPEGYEPVAAVALGYLGEPESLPDDLKAREVAPRQRRPIEEFVFFGSWGESASIAPRLNKGTPR